MRFASVLGATMVMSSAAIGGPLLVINFDDRVPAMSNSPGLVIPEASRLADQYLATHQVRFASGSPFVPVVNLGSGTPSPPRGIGGSTTDGRLTYQSSFPIVIRFLSADGANAMVVSTVSIFGDSVPIAGTKTLNAFDVTGGALGSVTVPDGPMPLVFSAPGIHRVEITGSSATIAFDDLSFDQPALACSICAGDVDADSMVGLSDLAVIIACWAMPASCEVCADLDGSGDIGLGDVAAVITRWDTSCR